MCRPTPAGPQAVLVSGPARFRRTGVGRSAGSGLFVQNWAQRGVFGDGFGTPIFMTVFFLEVVVHLFMLLVSKSRVLIYILEFEKYSCIVC